MPFLYYADWFLKFQIEDELLPKLNTSETLMTLKAAAGNEHHHHHHRPSDTKHEIHNNEGATDGV